MDEGENNNDSNRKPYLGYEEEKDLIASERAYMKRRSDKDNREDDSYVGLALSGGGIRSASFCLGVMQALAKYKALKQVDYLSTVSGGGYIGSSLSWFLHKMWDYENNSKIRFGVDAKDFPFGTHPNERTDNPGAGSREKMSILRHLRQNLNYLFPGNGIGPAALFSALLRGFFINIIVYGPVLVFLLIILALLASQSIRLDSILFWFVMPFDAISAEGNTIISMAHLSAFMYLAGLCVALNVVLSIFYGVFASFSRLSPTFLYRFHLFYLRLASKVLIATGILLIIGSLPHVMHFLNESRVESGVGITFSGIVSGVWSYFRTSSTKAPIIKIPTNVIVSLSAALLIYGVLILGYIMADIVLTESVILIEDLGSFPLYVWGLIVPLGLGLFVNINYVTLHGYYRDRLMELFMPILSKVSIDKPASPAFKANKHLIQDICDYEEGAAGPYHIINTNIMLPGSKLTKFKGRGGDNFILSPLYCGSSATGWQTSEEFIGGKMSFASAMAISGAAVNPNTGGNGSGATRNYLLSAVMAILNLRLGVWVENPDTSTVTTVFQPNLWRPGLYDCLLPRKLNETSGYIELSDGGHFENLGLYELIRREVGLIIVCDAGCDKDFDFEDFSNLVEKVRLDFGVQIDIDLQPMIPQPGDNLPYGLSEIALQGYAIGNIKYSGNNRRGKLIYLKTTVTYGLPADVYGYKLTHDEFPDETTSDQMFDEKQFEAYRELGYQLGKQMLKDLPTNLRQQLGM